MTFRNLLAKIPAPLLAMLVIFSGTGVAVLVSYLSNTVGYTATIESPLVLHDQTPADGNFGTIYGGDTREVIYLVDNRANNDVPGIHEIVISGPSDLDGSEITSISFEYNAVTYTASLVQTTDVNGDGKIDLVYQTDGANPVVHPANSVDVQAKWTITFDPAIEPGDYQFNVTIRP